MTTDPICIWKREDGCFAWMREFSDDIHDACACICESMAGCTDEEIDRAIKSYLAGLLDERRATLN
jgi:hypothetical protein